MIKKKITNLFIFAIALIIILSIAIAYTVKGKSSTATSTDLHFAAGMYGMFSLVYLLQIKSVFELSTYKNKSVFLKIILCVQILFFIISPILVIIYLQKYVMDEKALKEKKEVTNE